MAHFKPIFHLTVAHSFFADGRCTNLLFSPTPASQRLLQQHQLLVRGDDNGFSLVADMDVQAAFDEEDVVRFEVFARDPYFGIYTDEIYSRSPTAPLYCSTRNITADNTSLVLDGQVPAESQDARSGRAKPGTQYPLVVVDIDLSNKKILAAIQDGKPVEYQIQFNTREVYWKYYFFGELAKMELDIHDLSPQASITFDPSDEAVAKNGKAFISQQPIAMNSAPKQRFQLQEKSNSGKILIKRLPNAGINLISKSRDLRGQQIVVAEIYVNQ